jgi:plastocyanin
MRRLLPFALLCAGVAAGCGGDDEEPPRREVTVPKRGQLRVKADEYSFDPARVVIEGGGGPLEIVLDNRGSLAHNLKVLRGGRELGGTPTFPGGEKRSGTVRLGPGRYRIVCTLGSHEELGMSGELEVR